MPASVLSWPAVIQCVVAGVVVGMSLLHASWIRGGDRRSEARWTLVLSLSLAMVTLFNGLLGVVPADATEALLLLRYCAIGASVVVCLPAVRAYTGGTDVRLLGAVLGGWYVVGVALWLTTDLVHAHRLEAGLPVPGPLAAAVVLVPVVVVGLYLLRSVRGLAVTPSGGVVIVTGFFSIALLIASTATPPTELTELLRGAWVIPLVIGLQVVATARLAAIRREALQSSVMRDALATVTNAAWLLRTPDQVLVRARDEARTLLGDPSIEGSLRPLARDRFVTEFFSTDGCATDAVGQAFLRDLARVVSSAAERNALTARLRSAAFTDSLTGLHNRHSLDRMVTEALEKANVERTRVAVLFCDLDDFKHVNDRHGHDWGDSLLILVAEHLRRTVGSDAILARHGGDEFVVLVERAGPDAELCELAQRLRDEFDPPGHGVAPTRLTIGIASWRPGDIVDPSALLREADLAMLEGKRSHAGVALFDTKLRARMKAQSAVRQDLERGMACGEIVAHFQPLTDTATLEVVGLEVLARWRRDGRLRHPAEWLPLAEETGLIVEIGRQMFVAARAGSEKFDLPVAVNVAARQLDERDFVQQVERSWGTDGWDRLTIEVTESALLYDAAHVRASLATLVERGVRIALDDFGTGYNSLSRLGELPLQILKIDRTFVRDITTPEGAAVLRAILALAAAHGLDVVAEGVERAAELTALMELGVEVVQGHMLGRPSPSVPIRGRRPLSRAVVPAQGLREISPAASV